MMFLASIIVGLAAGEIYGAAFGWLSFGLALFLRSLILRVNHYDYDSECDEDLE